MQEKRVGKAKKITRPRKSGDDGEGGRPVARKRKRKQPVEIDLSELPPEQGASIFMVAYQALMLGQPIKSGWTCKSRPF